MSNVNMAADSQQSLFSFISQRCSKVNLFFPVWTGTKNDFYAGVCKVSIQFAQDGTPACHIILYKKFYTLIP